MATSTPAPPQQPANAATTDPHSRAAANWHGAHKVVDVVNLSMSLHTLRSMHQDVVICPDHLRLVKRLGEGAFAHVDLCWYSGGPGQENKLVAVKHLKPHVFQDEANLQAFIREARLMQRISHSNIISCYGVGALQREGTDTMYCVEEYMAGGTLKNMVLKQQLGGGKGVYKRRDALRWCIQIAKGLAYLHASKPMVIHRDLKLENILLSGPCPSQMDAKIADFGLAACVDHWIAQRKEASIRAGKAYYQSTPAASITPASKESSVARPPTPPAPSTSAVVPAPSPQRPITTVSSQQSIASSAVVASNNEGSAASGSAFYTKVEGLKQKASTFAATLARTSKSQAPPTPRPTELFRLSGHTGSLMYMAPEVYRTEPYNEKADVFSFSMLMLEVLTGHVLSTFMAPNGYTSEVEEFAHKVATENFRPPLPATVPQPLAALVRDCWAAKAEDRPNMAEVVQRLKVFEAEEERLEEERRERKKGRCGCFGG